MALYEIQPNTLVGKRYRVQARLGDGAFGVVYAANHEIFGTQAKPGLVFRQVALKIFKDQYVHRDNALEVFQEAIAIEELHARARASGSLLDVVTVYDIGVLEDLWLPYVAMELVDGGPLRPSGVVTLKSGVEILRRVCRAMSLVHAAGKIHRDLKPANILYAKSGVLKVSDFGLAIARHRALGVAGRAGTVGYAPPEAGAVSPQFDVYSLGVILLEFVLGRNPLHVVVQRELPLLPAQERLAELLDPLDARPLTSEVYDLRTNGTATRILKRCLQMDPGGRFANAGELEKELALLAAELDGAAPGPISLETCDELLRLARRARESRRFEEAARQLNAARGRCAHGDPRLPAEWSVLHEALGDLKAAIAAQEDSVGRHGGRTAPALTRLADLYERTGSSLKAMPLREEARRQGTRR